MGAQKANTVEGSDQKQPVTSRCPEQARWAAFLQLPEDVGGGTKTCVAGHLWARLCTPCPSARAMQTRAQRAGTVCERDMLTGPELSGDTEASKRLPWGASEFKVTHLTGCSVSLLFCEKPPRTHPEQRG